MACLTEQAPLQSPSKQAAITIIRNIFQFSQILNQSFSQDVGQWDVTSVNNAIHWALYCEEIYKHVHGQECEDSLISQLNQMTFLLQPASCIHLCVSSLQNATHLLVEALLANPHTTPLLKDSLQKRLAAIGEAKKTTRKHMKERIESTQTSIQVIKDVASLLSTSMQNGNSILAQSSLKTASESLIRRLTEVLKNTCNKDRFQTYCYSVCDRIIEERTGWNLLMYCVALDQNVLPCTEGIIVKQVCDCILYWMMKKLESSPEVCPIWDAKPDILRKSSEVNATKFFKFYTLALDKWAGSFQPIVNSVNPFHWRAPSGHTDTDLTDHLKGFLLCSGDFSQASHLLNFLDDKLKSFDFTVWQRVAQNLLKDN